MSSDFRLKAHPLRPNPKFIQATHKNEETQSNDDAFDEFRSYESKIGLLFQDIPIEHRFWLMSGDHVNNLKELYEALGTMTDDVYLHHVRGTENDFAEWVKDVYHDEGLAMQIFHAQNRQEARQAIETKIDNVIPSKEEKEDKNFFKSLIYKLSKQNEKLEEELSKKKDWLMKRQKELEGWEMKNIQHEKKLLSKYKKLEDQEQHIYDKFQKLKDDEVKLRKDLDKERKQISDQAKDLMKQKHAIEKKHDEVKKKHEEVKKKEAHHHEMLTKARRKRHEPIYTRLDELMGYATACIHNRNFKEARDVMSKVRYYYTTLPNDDPMKKEFYSRIVKLKKHINDTLQEM